MLLAMTLMITLSDFLHVWVNQELTKLFINFLTVSKQWKERVEGYLAGMLWSHGNVTLDTHWP